MCVGPAEGAFFLWDIALKFGNAPMLALLGYSAPVISTILLVLFGYVELSIRVVLATVLIEVGGLLSSDYFKIGKISVN